MGYTDIVKLLLTRGGDIRAQTDKGESCLHLATRGNQLEVMAVLLDRGADVNARAKVGVVGLVRMVGLVWCEWW